MGSPTCISLPLTHSPSHHHSHHHSHSHRHTSSESRNPRRLSRSNIHNPLAQSNLTSPAATVLTRPELNRSATSSTTAPRASALLSKVVSVPGSRRNSPPASVIASPINEKNGMHFHDSHYHHDASRSGDVMNSGEVSPQWEDVLRYWHGHVERKDGYISFPDFENFVSQPGESDGSQERSKT